MILILNSEANMYINTKDYPKSFELRNNFLVFPTCETFRANSWQRYADPRQSVSNNKLLCNKSRPFEQVGNFCEFSSFYAGSWHHPQFTQWME